MVFYWNLGDSNSQVSRTFLSILANLNNAVVWIVLTCSLFSSSSNPLTEPLGTIPSMPIKISITAILIFSFLSSLAAAITTTTTLCMFFTPVLANGLSLESEWKEVSSSLPDSSQHSGQSQQCCNLHGFELTSDFQLFQSPFQDFGDYSKCSYYNWYPSCSTAFLILIWFLWFALCGLLGWQNPQYSKFSFFVFL